MPEGNGRSLEDLYELLGVSNGRLEEIKLQFDQQRDDIKEMRREVATVAKTCPLHEHRLTQIEGLLRGRKPPTGNHPSVMGVMPDMNQLERKVKEVAEDASENFVEEVTGKIQLQAVQAAREAAASVFSEQRAREEAAREGRTKRLATWLQIISTVLALLGGSGIIAAVKFMSGAREAIDEQSRTIKHLRPGPTPASRQLPPHDDTKGSDGPE